MGFSEVRSHCDHRHLICDTPCNPNNMLAAVYQCCILVISIHYSESIKIRDSRFCGQHHDIGARLSRPRIWRRKFIVAWPKHARNDFSRTESFRRERFLKSANFRRQCPSRERSLCTDRPRWIRLCRSSLCARNVRGSDIEPRRKSRLLLHQSGELMFFHVPANRTGPSLFERPHHVGYFIYFNPGRRGDRNVVRYRTKRSGHGTSFREKITDNKS